MCARANQAYGGQLFWVHVHRLLCSLSVCLQVQSGALNQSVSLSPFNINLLLLASSPTGSDVGSSQGSLGIETEKDGDKLSCNDSLGMLSTVAMYHSGLSEGSGGEGEQAENEGGRRREKMSSVPAAVGDGLAQMRLESSSGKTLSLCVCTKSVRYFSLPRHSRHYTKCGRSSVHSSPTTFSFLLLHSDKIQGERNNPFYLEERSQEAKTTGM